MNELNNINEIKDLKERLTKVNYIFLHQDEPQFSDVDWDSVTEEFFLLKTRMEEILKTLPIDERDRIVWEDFEACVARKTAEPLLWICGIDVSELLMYADTWMDYSPDVDIGLRVCPDEEGKDVLYFSYRVYGITESSSFNLFNMEEKFRYTLDKAEAYKEAYLDETKESLTGEESVEELEEEDPEL